MSIGRRGGPGPSTLNTHSVLDVDETAAARDLSTSSRSGDPAAGPPAATSTSQLWRAELSQEGACRTSPRPKTRLLAARFGVQPYVTDGLHRGVRRRRFCSPTRSHRGTPAGPELRPPPPTVRVRAPQRPQSVPDQIHDAGQEERQRSGDRAGCQS